jgi:hypothetical protein
MTAAMKQIFSCAMWLAGFALAASAQIAVPPGTTPSLGVTPPPVMMAPFDLGSVIVSLTENPAVPATVGRTAQDLAAALGGTVTVDVPLLDYHYVAIHFAAPMKFGRAFRLAQQFDFGTPGRWQLRGVDVNAYGFFPENVPLSIRRVFNLSARAEVRTGESATIGGLIVPGEYPQLVAIKVRGASLRNFGLQQPLANPAIKLYEGANVILENDDWGALRTWEKDLARQLCPMPDDAREAMLVTYLDPGAYTAVVSGVGGETGVALVEMYLLDAYYVRH